MPPQTVMFMSLLNFKKQETLKNKSWVRMELQLTVSLKMILNSSWTMLLLCREPNVRNLYQKKKEPQVTEELEKDQMDRMMVLTGILKTAIYRPVPMEPLTEALPEQMVMIVTARPTSMDH